MKKLSLILLFAVLLTASVLLASCNKDSGDNGSVTTQGTQAAGETTAAPGAELTKEELVVKKLNELSAGKSYNGDEIRFFSRSPAYHTVWYSQEIYAEEEKNEPLNDAIYRRNRIVEDKFGITIAETQCSTKDLTSEMRTLILADDKDMDVFMPNFTVAGVLAGEELLYDLYEVPNLDLTSPWWDQQEVANLGLYGTLYFAIGDLCILDKLGTRGMFFNKSMIADYSLDSPYELVEKNEWTIEKMYEMMQVVAEDINTDGVRDNSDRYGLVCENNSLQNMMNAAGGTSCTLDEKGEPVITFMSDKTQSCLSKIMNVMFDKNTTYNDQSVMYKRNADFKTNERDVIWRDGRSLFYEIGFNNLERFREFDVEFGIVPMPKTDTAEPWHSAFYVDAPSLVCVPITNTDLERTGTILEALCAESSITLRPAYFDVCIEGKYTRDEESIPMLDIIFASRVYDLGIIFKLGNIYQMLALNLAAGTSTNVASNWATRETTFQNDLNKIIDVYS